MAGQVFAYDPPERFVAGTVGEPGSRTFYLQARAQGRITSVALEKQQVAVLAERVEELLDEVVRRSGGESTVPAVAPAELDDVEPLEPPILEDFRVGTMALEWDEDTERVVISAQADEEEDPDVLQVRVSGAVARAFAKRAQSVVTAGRPPCPFCGLPLDPAGHICPRANGYRR